MPNKLSIEFVKNAFKDRGYTLLEEEYISKDTPMRYECPKHPDKQTQVSYNSLRNGTICRYCSSEKRSRELRLPYEEVVNEFHKVGYKLLSTEYRNARINLNYQCPRHPDLSLNMSLTNLKSGKRCKACRNLEASIRNMTPFEEVKKTFEERGFELLETSYSGKGKLRFKCPKHPDKFNSITLAHLKNKKYGCPYCARVKVDFEDVKKEFDDRYCQLLDREYINDKKKLNYRCLFHPSEILKISYDKFRSGQRGCSLCSNRFHASYEEVKQVFEQRGYHLLENSYIDSEKKLAYICPYHPNKYLFISYQKIKNGRGCRYCAAQQKAAKFRLSYTEVKSEFIRRGYELIEADYVNNTMQMRYLCKNHLDNESTISFKDLKSGKGCPYCFNDQYTGEGGSAAWKGGISSINGFLRAELKEWIKDSLKNSNYKCAITLQGGELEVHHTKSFKEVRDEVLKELDFFKKKYRYQFTQNELYEILARFKEKHNNITGIPLKPHIHRHFHKVYGRNDVTLENFDEFKKRYIIGEFL